MNILALAAIRRHWRLIGAITAFLVFTIIHVVFYRPTVARYRDALTSVGGIEAVFNPGGGRPMLPPRVYALITQNSLTPQDAADRGGSGALGVILLEELGRMARQAGLVVVASEPGLVSQESFSAQVRVHLTLRGSYGSIVRFFDEMDRSESLVLVERFSIAPGPSSEDLLEVWVSRLYLKQAGSNP